MIMAIATKCTCGYSLTGICSLIKECKQLINMEENTQLPKEVVKSISDAAAKSASIQEFNYPADNWTTVEVAEREHIAGYELGAIAYATKLHQANEAIKVLTYDNNRLKGEVTQVEKANSELLCEYNEAKKLLNEVFRKHESGLLPDRFIYEKIKTFLYGE